MGKGLTNRGGVNMVWTLEDYPSSMKNLNGITRKKAVDIANSGD